MNLYQNDIDVIFKPKPAVNRHSFKNIVTLSHVNLCGETLIEIIIPLARWYHCEISVKVSRYNFSV